MKELCTWVRQLPVKDICIGIRKLQLGVRHLPLKDLCVGVRQLQLQDMDRVKQLPSGGCYSLRVVAKHG